MVTFPDVQAVGLGLEVVERPHALVPAPRLSYGHHLGSVGHPGLGVAAVVGLHLHWVFDGLVDSLGWGVGALVALHG